jgi:hypothetical protein
VHSEPIHRVVALKLDPAIVAICNGELGSRARIISARDAHAACRMILSEDAPAAVMLSGDAPFWDVHVVRDHADRARLPVVAVGKDPLPYEVVREIEAALMQHRRRARRS